MDRTAVYTHDGTLFSLSEEGKPAATRLSPEDTAGRDEPGGEGCATLLT